MEPPKGHPSIAQGHSNNSDYEMCPYMANQKRGGTGGCPMMNIAEPKKNPKLAPAKMGVDIPYSTAFDFLFKENALSISGIAGKNRYKVSRKRFLSHPKHLKITLFLDNPQLLKIREMEVLQKYMVIDEIKEIGNEHYSKGEYQQAINSYIQAYACIRWLEFLPKKELDKEKGDTDGDYENNKGSLFLTRF